MRNEIRQYIAVLALVLVGMFGGVENASADVTGPEWGQEGGTGPWYIYKKTLSGSDNAKNTGSISIYTPNENSTCLISWSAKSHYHHGLFINYDGDINFFLEAPVATKKWTSGDIVLSTDRTGSKNDLSIAPYTTTLKYGWTNPGDGSEQNSISVTIELPPHYDLLNSTIQEDPGNIFGTTAIEIGSNKSYEFNFDSYFKSYYTQGAITIAIVDAPNHTGESSMFHIGAPTGGQGSTSVIPANVVYAAANTCSTAGIARSDGGSSKKVIYYVPTDEGSHEAYLNIYYNGGTNPIKQIKLTGKGKWPTLDFGNVNQCFTKEKTITGLANGSSATVSKETNSGTDYYIDYFVSADGSTWGPTANVGPSGILYVKYQPSNLCNSQYKTSKEVHNGHYNKGTITITNGTKIFKYNVTGTNKGIYIAQHTDIVNVLDKHVFGPTGESTKEKWFSFTKTINSGDPCNNTSYGYAYTDGMVLTYPAKVRFTYAGTQNEYHSEDFMICDYATPNKFWHPSTSNVSINTVTKTNSSNAQFVEAGFRIAYFPTHANQVKTGEYHAQCQIYIKSDGGDREYIYKYRIVNGEEEQTVDGFNGDDGQGIDIGNSSSYQAFNLNGFRGFGSTENGTATVGCNSNPCDAGGQADVLFSATGGVNDTWSPTLTIQNGVQNIYIKYAPQTERTDQETKTIFVRDNNNNLNRTYQFKVQLGTAHYKTLTFNEATAVGSTSTEIQKCELSNFSPSGNLNVQVINPNGQTNFIVCEASSGTYGQSCVITNTQSPKEFYVKFAPQVSGTLYNETIRVTDNQTGRTYDILVKRIKPKATIQFNYSLENLAKSSSSYSINLANYAKLVDANGVEIQNVTWSFAPSGTCSGFTVSNNTMTVSANSTGSGKISITASGVTDYDIVTNPILVDVSITESSVSTCSYTAPKQGSWSNYVWTFNKQLGESHSVYPTNVDAEFSVLNVSTKEQGENCKLNILDANNQLITYYVFPHSGSSSYRNTNIGPISLAGKNISTITFKLVEDQTDEDDIDLDSWPVNIVSAVITQESKIKLISPSSPSLVFSSSTTPQSPHTTTQQTIKIKYSACGEITASLSGTDAGCFAVASHISTSNNCTVGTIDIPVYFTPTTGKGDYTAKLTLKPKAGDAIEIDLSGYCKKRDQIVTFTSPTTTSYVYSPNGHTINLAAKTNVTPFTGETGLSTYTYSIVSRTPDDDVASLSGSTLTLGSTGTVCVKAHNDGTDCTNAADGLIYIKVTPADQTIEWDDDKKDQTITTCTGNPVTLGASSTSGEAVSYDLTLDADASTCVTSINDLVKSQTGGTITFQDNYPAAKINVAASVAESRNYAAVGPVNGTVTITPCSSHKVTWTQNLSGLKYGDKVELVGQYSTYETPGGSTYTFNSSAPAVAGIDGSYTKALKAGSATADITVTQDQNSCYNEAVTSSPANTATIGLSPMKMVWKQADLTKDAIGESTTVLSSLTAPYAIDKRHSETVSGYQQTWFASSTKDADNNYPVSAATDFDYRLLVDADKVDLLSGKTEIAKLDNNGNLIITGHGSGEVTLAVTEKSGISGQYSAISDGTSTTVLADEESIKVTVEKITPTAFALDYTMPYDDGLHMGDYITINSIKAMYNGNEIKDCDDNPIYSWAESRNSYKTTYTSYPVTGGYGIYIAPRSNCAISSKETKEKIRMNVGNNAKPKVRIGIGTADAVSNAEYFDYTIKDDDGVERTVANTGQEIVCKKKNATITVAARTTPYTFIVGSYVFCVDTRHSSGRSNYDGKPGYTNPSSQEVYYGATQTTIQAVTVSSRLNYSVTGQTHPMASCTDDLVTIDNDATNSDGKFTPKITILGPAGTATIHVETTGKTTSNGTSYYNAASSDIKVTVSRINPDIKLSEDGNERPEVAASGSESTLQVDYGNVYDLSARSFKTDENGNTYYESSKDNGRAFSFAINTSETLYSDNGEIINDTQFRAKGVGISRLTVTQNPSCYVKSTSNTHYYYNVVRAKPTVNWGQNITALGGQLKTSSRDITLDAYRTLKNNKNNPVTIPSDESNSVTYKVWDGTKYADWNSYVEIVNGNVLKIKEGLTGFQSGTTIEIKAIFAESEHLLATDGTLTLTLVSDGIDLQNVPTTETTLTGLTSTTENFDLIEALKNLTPKMTTNYGDKCSYSIELVDPTTTVAEVVNNKLTASEEAPSGNPLEVKITATDKVIGTSDNETVKLIIGKGTLIFGKTEGGESLGAGKWTESSKWSRDDIVQKHIDNNNVDLSEYNVEIADSCFIGTDSSTVDEAHFMDHNVNVSCYDLTFRDNDKSQLVIGEASTLDVKHNLMNGDSTKLVLTANRWGQASVLFNNGTSVEKPKATIEMFILAGNGNNVDPIWQYRGIAVDNFKIAAGKWHCMAIYQWNEAKNSDPNNGCWTAVTTGGASNEDDLKRKLNNKLQPWVGYAFANICTTDKDTVSTWLSYTGTLINDHVHTFSLSKTPANEETTYKNQAVNLLTNSFTAPIRIGMVTYGDSVNNTVTFYNAGSYTDWTTMQGRETGSVHGDPGQASVCPQYTTGKAQNILSIPSGQSFFITAKYHEAKVRFMYDSIRKAFAPSLRMFMPGERDDEYNLLGIRVSSESGADRVALLECDHCSRQYDNGYDGYKTPGNEGLPQIYAYNKFGNTAVNADSTFNKQFVGFNAGNDDETYTISFETDQLFGYHSLYLVDRKLDQSIDILAGETYSFKGYSVGENMRFQINGITEEEWQNQDNDDDDDNGKNQCDLRVIGNSLYVQGFTTFEYPGETINIYDMTGNLVWSTPLTAVRLYDLPVLPNGVYTIRLGDCYEKYVVK